ncbi:MAG TPA: TlpA disulfide reductase family protein, partial [Chitinophagaceae bacterium]|nr:TlpA disulfide reductase family protein [Chitinophagaceae bacterium]
MRRRLISILAILLPLLNLYAQIKPLGIGDTMPDVQLNNIINYPVSQIPLSPFKNKHTIIDFWATWCSSCIHHFQQLDSLQKQYPQQLQVLLVNSKNSVDTKEKITGFIANYRSTHPGFS